ncbi:MAG: SCP2 sterol-binding domain-containing protein [Acidimicrobiales bacterium]
MAAFNEAAAGVVLAPPGPDAGLAARDGDFAVRQVVRGGPDGERVTTLRVAGGRVSMALGDDGPADVVVTLDWDDARALSQGRFSATEALAAGRVRVRGDLSVLGAAGAVLDALSPRLEALRAATDE